MASAFEDLHWAPSEFILCLVPSCEWFGFQGCPFYTGQYWTINTPLSAIGSWVLGDAILYS